MKNGKRNSNDFFAVSNNRGAALLVVVLIQFILTGIILFSINMSLNQTQNRQQIRILLAKDKVVSDLSRFIRMPSSIRNSATNPANIELKNCLITPLSCGTVSRYFLLFGPLYGSQAIAGSQTQTVYYNQMGHLCGLMRPESCPIRATAYFTILPGANITITISVDKNPLSALKGSIAQSSLSSTLLISKIMP